MYKSADEMQHAAFPDEEYFEENTNLKKEPEHNADVESRSSTPNIQHTMNLDTFPTLPSPPPTAIELSLLYTSHPLSKSLSNASAYMLDLYRAGRSSTRYPIAPDGIIPNSKIRQFYRPFEICSQRPPQTKSAYQLRSLPDETRMKKLMDTYSDQLDEPIKSKKTTKNFFIKPILVYEPETKLADSSTGHEEKQIKTEEKIETTIIKRRRQINVTTQPIKRNSRFNEFARTSVKEEEDAKSDQNIADAHRISLDAVLASPSPPSNNEVIVSKPARKARSKAIKTKKKERPREKGKDNKSPVDAAQPTAVKIIDSFHLKRDESTAQSNLHADHLRLLEEIMAESWFTLNHVALDMESVVLALLSLMSNTQHALKHEAMCTRLLQIKEKMTFSTEFEMKVLKELLRQMDKLTKEVKLEMSGRSQTVEEMRDVLLRLLIKKIENLIKVLNSFGEDTSNTRFLLETLRSQTKVVSEITLPQNEFVVNAAFVVSPSSLKPLMLLENVSNEVATMMVIYDEPLSSEKLQLNEKDDDENVEVEFDDDENDSHTQLEQAMLSDRMNSETCSIIKVSDSDLKSDYPINWSTSPVSDSLNTEESSGIFTVSTEFMQVHLNQNPSNTMIGRDDSLLENSPPPSVDEQNYNISSNLGNESGWTNHDGPRQALQVSFNELQNTYVFIKKEAEMQSVPEQQQSIFNEQKNEVTLKHVPLAELRPTHVEHVVDEEFLPGMDDIIFSRVQNSTSFENKNLLNTNGANLHKMTVSNSQNDKPTQNPQLARGTNEVWTNAAEHREVKFANEDVLNKKAELKIQYGVDSRYLVRPSFIPSSEWSRICTGTFGRKNSATSGSRTILPDIVNGGLLRPEHCRYEHLVKRGLHKPGISVSRHLDRYDLIDSLYGFRSTT